jgi:hypothetical protein
MPTIYLNGGSPNYTGAIFTNANELLALIKQTLEDAGWVTVAYDAGVNLFVKGTTLVNAHNCWVEFAISDTTLIIRGWLEEAKTNGSPNSIHTHVFTPTGTNRLWLTADEDSGCICIFDDSTGVSTGTHFGFLQRIDFTDPWAWMIGQLRSDGLNFAYSAKSGHNGTNWKKLSDDFYFSTNFASDGQCIPVSTFDLLAQGKPGSSSSAGNYSTQTSGQNAFLNPLAGRLSPNNQAIIAPYYYLEGRGSPSGYGNNESLFFRGYVKYAKTGLASLLPASQVLDPFTGDRILSTGASSWQGMRIL